jgi:Putative MetA-pathway of phenol degradation
MIERFHYLGPLSLLLLTAFAFAEDGIVANPSRPTVANAADTTPAGNLEMEYGLTADTPGSKNRAETFSSSLRLGVHDGWELRWSFDNYVSTGSSAKRAHGPGDNSIAIHYRLNQQTKRLPSFGLMYTVKLPTADWSQQLGTGYADHFMVLMMSKDVSRLHLDFNVIGTVFGEAHGHSAEPMFALAGSMPLVGKWTAIAEAYGGWQAGHQNFSSTRCGLAYKLRPRMIVDAAIDTPVSGPLGKLQLLVGVTYAIHRF